MPVRGKGAGNRGQGSKWIGRSRRQRIYMRDDYKCVWCTRTVCEIPDCPKHGADERATLDHIVSRSEGGSNATNNLITACMSCNRLRGDTPWFRFALQLARQPGFEEQPPLRGGLLRWAAKPIRFRVRRILNTDWGF